MQQWNRLDMGSEKTRVANLASGEVSVTINSGHHWGHIFDFAERRNPKRAFLFVSTVLGRHVPVEPHLISRAFSSLAESIPADLPGPVVMTGMAETAVGLGAGVHDAFVRKLNRDDILYLSTTRASLEGEVLFNFDEEHSHASRQLVYRPQHEHDLKLLENARSLIMVDDEVSTGRTFNNLARAFIGNAASKIERVHTAVLTDWGDQPLELSGIAGQITATRSALVAGSYQWRPDPSAIPEALPDSDVFRQPPIRLERNSEDARLGRSSLLAPPDVSAIVDSLKFHNSKSVLIVGTGEHVWQPFLIAEELEDLGYTVKFSATTRSPIKLGHAIRSRYVFSDHEGIGITNYLYNVRPDMADQIIVCIESDAQEADPALLKALSADLLVGESFSSATDIAERTEHVQAAELHEYGRELYRELT